MKKKIDTPFQRLILTGLFSLFSCVFAYSAVAFEQKSQGTSKSSLRLIAASTEWQGETKTFAGIEIRLAPKWKTYWRTPGDTGIPPYFDWSGSENLKSAEVMYPIPARYEDPIGITIGYKSQVTLPVLLTPIDPSKPIKLNLSAQYAICYDLCVPVSASQKLTVDQAETNRFAPLLSMALSLTPKPVTQDDEGPGVKQVQMSEDAQEPFLTLNVAVPETSQKVDLFVEGPDGLYVPTPELVKGQGEGKGRKLYKINLADVDEPKQFKDLVLTCTLRADDVAVVHPCRVE